MSFVHGDSLTKKVGSHIDLRLADKESLCFTQEKNKEDSLQSKVDSEEQCDMKEWMLLYEAPEEKEK